MNLGEARSKCEHIAGVPLRPTVARELHQLYLAKGVLGTTAIEGNTLSEEQVRQLLEGQLNSRRPRNTCNRKWKMFSALATKSATVWHPASPSP